VSPPGFYSTVFTPTTIALMLAACAVMFVLCLLSWKRCSCRRTSSDSPLLAVPPPLQFQADVPVPATTDEAVVAKKVLAVIAVYRGRSSNVGSGSVRGSSSTPLPQTDDGGSSSIDPPQNDDKISLKKTADDLKFRFGFQQASIDNQLEHLESLLVWPLTTALTASSLEGDEAEVYDQAFAMAIDHVQHTHGSPSVPAFRASAH
jgi:hypothetical protein